MLTLVGGASDKYGNNLIAVLENLTRIINNKCHDYKQFNIVIYDLGLSKTYIEQVKQFTHVTIETLDFDKYPEHVSLKKYYGRNCNYSWKPIIIHEVCEKYGGLVHWFDCRTTYTSLNGLKNFIGTNGIYSPISSGTIQKWTHKDTMEYMDGYKYKNRQPRAGGIFGINYDIPWCKELVTEWKNLALVKECICPNGSDRTNHRQDQAVLSILFYKYHDKHTFNTFGKYICLQPHSR